MLVKCNSPGAVGAQHDTSVLRLKFYGCQMYCQAPPYLFTGDADVACLDWQSFVLVPDTVSPPAMACALMPLCLYLGYCLCANIVDFALAFH